MAQQIEPVTIPFKKNWGEYLFVFQSYPFTASNQVMAEILDKDGNLLYSIMLNATSYEEVAQQLGLTLIKTNNMAQETLEEAAKELYPIEYTGSMFMPNRDELNNLYKQEGFIEGAKWQQERMYSEEEVIELIQFLSMNKDFNGYGSVHKETAKYFLEQFKNSQVAE